MLMKVISSQAGMVALALFFCGWSFVSPSLGDEASEFFYSVFGSRRKSVRATSSADDDNKLATDLLVAAQQQLQHEAILTLLCNEAYELAHRHVDGYGTAAQAMKLLSQHIEKERPTAREKLIKALTQQSLRGRTDERAGAANALIALHVMIGDERMNVGNHTAAAVAYRRAIALSARRDPEMFARAKARLEFSLARVRAATQIKRLQEILLRNANDSVAAEKIVRLHVVDMDDPASALPFLNQVDDDALKQHVPLAGKPIFELKAADLKSVGIWYRSLGDSKKGSAKMVMYRNAKRYLDNFLELEKSQSLAVTQAKLVLKDINKFLETDKQPVQIKVESSAKRKIDLLKFIDPTRDRKLGVWTFNDGKLACTKVKQSLITVPLHVEGDFVFTLKFAYTEGDGAICILVPVGDTQTAVSIDHFKLEGISSGIETIDGKRILSNPTRTRGRFMKRGRPLTLVITVKTKGEHSNIDVKLDGKNFVTWTGKTSSLSIQSPFGKPNVNRLELYSWHSSVLFEQVELEMKSGGVRRLAPAR